MSYTHRQRPYNPRRHAQPIAYRSPLSSQPAANVLSRPHAMHPNLQKLRIDPPVLLLLTLCIVALLLWLSYGIYHSVKWYIHRLRTVRYGLEEMPNPDINMAKIDGRPYSSEKKGMIKFGQAVRWLHLTPTKEGYVKLEHAWNGNQDLSRHQSVSSGNALMMRGDDCKRVQGFGCRRTSAV
ncbi:hypothetical protein SBOR_7703 [Sclerotinia borealis F-4128]|uniref:Uncharacterized protein n=1 Tax=Sclerotinia borealis (strain F-4128) TaxID=1432307 RepID=W9CAL6_SCLBF|nr:hypothetical protein SBOR_7703 [Sclerotinia borealis F-4128]